LDNKQLLSINRKEIPIYTAIRLFDDSSYPDCDTRPLKIECLDEVDSKGPEIFIVKSFNNVFNSGFGIISEILCAKLAIYFGLCVPEFALVKISDQFRDAAYQCNAESEILTTLNQNIGIKNFGSKLIEKYSGSPIYQSNTQEWQKNIIETIFGFDCLIYNKDRTQFCPNLFVKDNQYILYDHEKAFCFLGWKNWKINLGNLFHDNNSSSFGKQHIFWEQLRNENCTFNYLIEKLNALDNDIIENLFASIPEELSSEFPEEIKTVKSYLIFLRDNSKGVKFELMRIMA
jgi:hypothetical protein